GVEKGCEVARADLRAGDVGAIGSGPADRTGRSPMARLTLVADKVAMSETAADRITSLIESAVATRGLAAVSLTGGDTPDLLYQFLADPNRPWRARIKWEHLHTFWGDEREVPPDHPESNFGLAHRLLIQHVPIPDTQVH